MHDLFVFEQTFVDETKMAQGVFRATGLRPRCLDRLNSSGQSLSMNLFERRILEPSRLDGIAQASTRL
jgi:pilus assembly protein CpaF